MCWEIALFSFSVRSRGRNAQPSITVMDGLVEIPSKSICIRHICHFVMHLIGRRSFLTQRRETLSQLLFQLGSGKMLRFSFQGGEFPVRCAFWSSLSAMTSRWLWACLFLFFPFYCSELVFWDQAIDEKTLWELSALTDQSMRSKGEKRMNSEGQKTQPKKKRGCRRREWEVIVGVWCVCVGG